MAQVKGHCDEKFDEVKDLLQQHIDAGRELGASITVNLDGRDVVDIWGGHTNKAKTNAWKQDTILNVFSTTKTVCALAILMIVDRGLLDVDERVSKYWPEFAANGKEDVLVGHLLAHTSGLSGFEASVTEDDFTDTAKLTSLLEQQAPWWKPGTASGYHSLTMGFPLGELVKRTTGKTLKQFVAEEIAAPLNADFQIGALEKDWPRISDLVSIKLGTEPPPKMGPLTAATFSNPVLRASTSRTASWRGAEVGAANGHGNSQSIARMLSAISLGGQVDGTRLLSQKTIDLIFQEQSNGEDLVLAEHFRWGNGFALSGSEYTKDWFPPGRICYWGGWGGSIIICDLDRRLTISYMMNKLGTGVLGNDRTVDYIQAVYRALEGAKPRL